MQGQGVFEVVNDGGMRQEIEINILTNNGAKFIGSITPKEAKFTIYKGCLGFKDFINFDGMRFGYCCVPTVTFRLKTPIKWREYFQVVLGKD